MRFFACFSCFLHELPWPTNPRDIIDVFRITAKENCVRGATKRHGLLLKLGHHISERTVSKCIPKRPPDPKKRLSWNKFYNLHSDCIVVKDIFSVYSINFQKIYRVIFYMQLGTRRMATCLPPSRLASRKGLCGGSHFARVLEPSNTYCSQQRNSVSISYWKAIWF